MILNPIRQKLGTQSSHWVLALKIEHNFFHDVGIIIINNHMRFACKQNVIASFEVEKNRPVNNLLNNYQFF